MQAFGLCVGPFLCFPFPSHLPCRYHRVDCRVRPTL
ncbi:hypothetical protein CFP56_035872 [Quercus suber]|uniref:Uncharacterized protein n=1 Tax=Quercus suber TaxID=58331 RepID=A0AAW0J8F1_QUESU